MRVLAALVAGAAAACCPPPEPVEPGSCSGPPAVVHPTPPVAHSPAPRAIPAPVLGRFQQPRPPTKVDPKREMITEPPVMPPGPRPDEVPARRETLAPPAAPLPPADRLPDDVVVRLLETGRAAFVRCFKKAIAADPTELAFKVRVHVEVDAAGAITAARTDATNPALDACLARSTGWLAFPATGKRVVVEFPLLYRGE
jgi:hypothetical protein